MTNDEPVKPRHIPHLTPDELKSMQAGGINPNHFGYSRSLYNSHGLNKFAAIMARNLWANTDLLISGGSSGCAIATAICMLRPNLHHIHIYSKKDRGHRNKEKDYSGWVAKNFKHIALVDDLIDSGTTARSVFKRFMEIQKEAWTAPIQTLDFYFFQECGEQGEDLLRDTLSPFTGFDSMFFCFENERYVDLRAQN